MSTACHLHFLRKLAKLSLWVFEWLVGCRLCRMTLWMRGRLIRILWARITCTHCWCWQELCLYHTVLPISPLNCGISQKQWRTNVKSGYKAELVATVRPLDVTMSQATWHSDFLFWPTFLCTLQLILGLNQMCNRRCSFYTYLPIFIFTSWTTI